MNLLLQVIVHKLLISWMEPKAWREISRRHGLPARCLLSCWSFSLSLAFVFPFRCQPLCSLAPPWNDSKPALQVAVFPFTGFSHKL
jgi:hypothetical protein